MINWNDINDNGFEENGNDKNASGGFELPQDYFDSLSSRLFQKLELEQELEPFQLLSSLPKKPGFSLPPEYFENLELQTELMAYPQLKAIPQKKTMALPENYFEQLTERVLQKIDLTEELSPFPLLAQQNKQHAFIVEESYFDTVLENVRKGIETESKSGIIDWIKGLFRSNNWAYAFSVLVLVISCYWLFQDKQTSSPCNSIACLEKQEILNSPELMGLDEESLIELIDLKSKSDSTITGTKAKKLDVDKLNYVLENSDTEHIIDEL